MQAGGGVGFVIVDGICHYGGRLGQGLWKCKGFLLGVWFVVMAFGEHADKERKAHVLRVFSSTVSSVPP